MVILNMGARSLRDEDFADIRNVLLPLAAQTPVVIVSDHAGQDEIVWSLEMRFRGYLPTSTEPSIAMSALTFILNGGDFFPPFVLGPPRARQNGYRDPSPPAREIKVSLPHDDDGFRD